MAGTSGSDAGANGDTDKRRPVVQSGCGVTPSCNSAAKHGRNNLDLLREAAPLGGFFDSLFHVLVKDVNLGVLAQAGNDLNGFLANHA